MTPPQSGSSDDQGPRDEQEALVDRDRLVQMGMRLFVASLVMLFASSVVAYMVLRSRITVAMDLPPLLWASTGLLAACGVSVFLLQRANHAQAWRAVKTWIIITVSMSLGFLFVQIPALSSLLAEHESASGPSLYGLTFVLIILHAVHVVGGLVPLGYLLRVAWAGQLGPSRSPAIKACCFYWHFLEVVWLLMFGVFLLAERW